VLLRVKYARNVDGVCLDLLEGFIRKMEAQKVTVILCGVRGDLLKVIQNVGWEAWLGPTRIFPEGAAVWSSTLQAVDRGVARLVDTLQSSKQLDNTYIIFTSDNGFHLGQHRLPFGKQTPYETDIHVPLVVRGPGVPANRTVDGFAREIDLAPTFATWAHATAPSSVDGVSLVPQLGSTTSGGVVPQDVLIEHYATGNLATRAQRRSAATAAEPDDDTNPPTAGTPTQGAAAALRQARRRLVAVSIPPYRALRTARYLYAEYSTGEKQLFDVVTDPFELHNLAATADPTLLATLSSRLAGLAACSGRSCRA